jgi:dipeptide/tripeptide permease
MHDYLQTRRTERLKQLTERQTRQQETAVKQHDRKISLVGILLAAVFGVPSLVIGFLNINLKGWTSSEGLSWQTAFAIVGGTLLIGIWVAYLHYKKEQPAAQTNEPLDASLKSSSETKNITE